MYRTSIQQPQVNLSSSRTLFLHAQSVINQHIRANALLKIFPHALFIGSQTAAISNEAISPFPTRHIGLLLFLKALASLSLDVHLEV
jgi:hypothetical protein